MDYSKFSDLKRMATLCAVTGDVHCHCDQVPLTALGRAMLLDSRATVRNLFVQHGIYTSWLITESLPILDPNADVVTAVTNRLLRNATDIAEFLEPIVGTLGRAVGDAFLTHLKLAAATLEPARNGDEVVLARAVNAFYMQGTELAQRLSDLNPLKFSLVCAQTVVDKHNQFVVKLTALRAAGDSAYVDTFDAYHAHIITFASMVYETLTP